MPRILPQIVLVALLGLLVALFQQQLPAAFPHYSPTALALLGVALSLFLGFRNNACYDRWWEARKQWGQLIVDTRSLARQGASYIDAENEHGTEAKRRLVYLTIAFSHQLRHQLRESTARADIERFLTPYDLALLGRVSNPADTLLQLLGRAVGDCRRNRLLSDILIEAMDQRLTSMAAVLAGCERIRNTPLPFAYRLLVQRTAYLYCGVLPFGLVASLGLLTPLFCAIVAYAFFGLDALSEELEQPFGLDANDLPLSALSRGIEISLLEVLGDANLPTPLQPEGYCLR